jgi:hypothetical protein
MGEATRPHPAQVAAIEDLLANDEAITARVLGRVLEQYPRLRREYNAMIADEIDDEVDEATLAVERRLGISSLRLLPAIRDRSGLREVLGLGTVHVLTVEKGGRAYLGFELGCEWDDEHGAGVMIHGRRVVDLGGADHAFLAWIAQRDGGRSWEATDVAASSKGRRARTRTRG